MARTPRGRARPGPERKRPGQPDSALPEAGLPDSGLPEAGRTGQRRKGPAPGGSVAGGVRGVAVRILTLVTEGGATLADALSLTAAGLSPADTARAQRLATETLRQAGRADRILGPYLVRRPPETVLNILRLGLVELGRGGAPHGVVNAAVAVANADAETRRFAGLVNAVLRRIATAPPDLDAMPPPAIPRPLRRRLVAAWGRPAVEAMEAVFARAPPVDLTPRGTGADAAEALARATGGRVLPTGSVRLGGPADADPSHHAVQISLLPGFAEGAFWVQDAAAALPARILAPRPGERILDMCAAPGGKTMQLAAAGARVTALDISPERLARVAENLARTGLAATLAAADALTFEAPPFDAILLDAPCSATGTLRRHPDLPHARGRIDTAPLVALQAALADRAVALLAPGGRLVVATCSLLPEEGEEAVPLFLGRHPDMRADAVATAHDWLAPEWRIAPGQIRTRPDHRADLGGIDGFHIAAYRKTPD